MNTLDDAGAQLDAVASFFEALADSHPLLPAAANDSQALLRA